MKSNPVIWFEIYVDEMERAKKFYEAVFQFSLEKMDSPEMEMWAFPMAMNTAGAAGTLVCKPGFPAGGNSVLVYFSCEDCSVEASRAAECGGSIRRMKSPIGEHGFISLINDSEGNMIGLHSMR